MVPGMTPLILLLFFLSGACGLVYEVVWSRMMTHVFGTTALAVGTVLAAYMSGLAVGGCLLGKVADGKRHPLRLYALLEVFVGLTALAVHFLLHRITPVYLAIYDFFGQSAALLGWARFILAFGLVMAPTLLMGATLPALARFFLRERDSVGADLSTLYASNTLGAVAGTLLAGFYLIGTFGIHLTVYVAVFGNIAIGICAWMLSMRTPFLAVAAAQSSDQPTSQTADVPGPWIYRLLLVGLLLSGLTSFAYEIYWVRSLVFFLGNSTYAVTTMLTAFLSGIALGGYLARFVVDRRWDRIALFGWLQVLIGVFSAIALPVLFSVSEPQAIRMFLAETSDQSGLLLFARFGVALLVMLIPATLIGATFPLMGRIGVVNLNRTGASVGLIYALNAFGNVLGALLPGLLLLHWFGIQRGILVMAVINTSVGLAILALRLVPVPRWRWAVPVALVAVVFALARAPLQFRFPSNEEFSWHDVLFYREGPSATTKVFVDPETGEKSMSVDGITIGGNVFTEYKQLLLAHLPKLLLEDVSTELTVGLGSGIVAGESARHQRVREITCVEIEPSVVGGAAFFSHENHGILRNARLRIVVDDIGNHLRTTGDVYRVISADEKTAEDFASNGFSYSKDYYTLLRRHLAPGGLLVQWVPTTLPPVLYRMILKTITESFPHVQLWYFLPGYKKGTANTLLVASNSEIKADLARMRRLMSADPQAFAGIRQYGLTSAEAVLAHFVADEKTLRPAVADAPVNTLVHPRYEFFDPWQGDIFDRDEGFARNHDFLLGLRQTAAPVFLSQLSAGLMNQERLRVSFVAEEKYLIAFARVLAGAEEFELYRLFDEILALAPWNDSLRARIFLQYWNMASSKEDIQARAEGMERALSVYGKSATSHVDFSMVLNKMGQYERALQEARLAVDLDPNLMPARRVLSSFLLQAGRRQEAKHTP